MGKKHYILDRPSEPWSLADVIVGVVFALFVIGVIMAVIILHGMDDKNPCPSHQYDSNHHCVKDVR